MVDEIEAFGLPSPEVITIEVLERVLGGSRVLCVCSEGRAGFAEAFARAGFPPESIDRFFFERCFPPGKHSNLMSVISQEAHHCEHLLYVWEGLRTLKADVKRKFSGKSYEAPSTVKVIEMFRKWLLGELTRLNQAGNEPGGGA